MSTPFGYQSTYVPQYQQGMASPGGAPQGGLGVFGPGSGSTGGMGAPQGAPKASNAPISTGGLAPMPQFGQDVSQQATGFDWSKVAGSQDPGLFSQHHVQLPGIVNDSQRDPITGRQHRDNYGGGSADFNYFSFNQMPNPQQADGRLMPWQSFQSQYQNYMNQMNYYYQNLYGQNQGGLDNLKNAGVKGTPFSQTSYYGGIYNPAIDFSSQRVGPDQQTAMSQAQQQYVDIFNKYHQAGYL